MTGRSFRVAWAGGVVHPLKFWALGIFITKKASCSSTRLSGLEPAEQHGAHASRLCPRATRGVVVYREPRPSPAKGFLGFPSVSFGFP